MDGDTTAVPALIPIPEGFGHVSMLLCTLLHGEKGRWCTALRWLLVLERMVMLAPMLMRMERATWIAVDALMEERYSPRVWAHNRNLVRQDNL